MQVRSGHIVFDKKTRYVDLLPVYEEIFKRFLEETHQVPEAEPEFLDVLVEENMADIRSDRKPEGYNRSGYMRLIFPLSDRVECYVYGRTKSNEVARITELLSGMFRRSGLENSIEWDKMLLYSQKK
ncbi:MAG: hypothetical protein ACE5QF_02990 [Thermoplasmata archaeon]